MRIHSFKSITNIFTSPIFPVWRGQNLVDDWVLQPGASVVYKNLTASVWENLDLTDENGY